jgi:(2Fe-2S) ferredoxin
MKFKKHIFICTNTRTDGRESCGEACGIELIAAFKEQLIASKLHTTMRVQKSGCLDVCKNGPAMVIYPEGVFYGNVTLNDVQEIHQKSILNDEVVERLKIEET